MDQRICARTESGRAGRAARGPALLLLLVVGSGCGASGGPEPEPLPDGAFVLDASAFVRDQPAVGADWYNYDGNTHAVTPKEQSYIVRQVVEGQARYAAFRVVSYYDSETAESGRFSLESSVYDGSWGAPDAWKVGQNIRHDGAACVDLFARQDVDCSGTRWHVQFRVFPLLIPEASLVVGNPGIFVRSVDGFASLETIHVATHGETDLAALPEPGALETIAAAEQGWHDVAWNRNHFATNLPHQGMALGSKLSTAQSSDIGDVVFLLTPSQALVRMVAHIDAEAGVVDIEHAVAAFDLETVHYFPFAEKVTSTLALPAAGEMTYLAFDTGALSEVQAASPVQSQLTPPFEKDWAVAMENTASSIRLVLSPSSAIYNATAEGAADASAFDDVMPPLGEEP